MTKPKLPPTDGALAKLYRRWPVTISHCADCGIGTMTLGEYYMVHRDVWEQAWAGRRKSWHGVPGTKILCIGCLERRLGRALHRCDFTDAAINNPDDPTMSERLRNRLTTATAGPQRSWTR